MSCNENKQSLIDAAASGASLPGALSDHLAACSVCRALYTGEQSLFTAIDAHLRHTGNAKMPLSFLNRVQASLAGQASSKWRRIPIWAFAYAAAFLFVLLMLQSARHSVNQSSENPSAPITAPIEVAHPQHASNMSSPREGHSRSQRPNTRAQYGISQPGSSEPEVLVPPGEEALLMRFCNDVRAGAERTATQVAQDRSEERRVG